jgi:uncharacterized protein YejL (UPF0352 family)
VVSVVKLFNISKIRAVLNQELQSTNLAIAIVTNILTNIINNKL